MKNVQFSNCEEMCMCIDGKKMKLFGTSFMKFGVYAIRQPFHIYLNIKYKITFIQFNKKNHFHSTHNIDHRPLFFLYRYK